MYKITMVLLLSLLSVNVFANTNSTKLNKVENSKVCMVNDTYFAKLQIPVQVDERTYYGCCENCKKTLKEDTKSRQAIDPISRKAVDKSTAIIGADSNGQVHYFESLANLNAFNRKKK